MEHFFLRAVVPAGASKANYLQLSDLVFPASIGVDGFSVGAVSADRRLPVKHPSCGFFFGLSLLGRD